MLSVAISVLRKDAFARHQAAQRYEDVYYLPDARALPVLSLGYRQALADVLWCRSLVYFGEELVQRGQVRYVFEYTDAILALDTTFRSAYRWVATASLYRPGEVGLDAGLRGSRYLRRALALWPDDGQLHWDYASMLRFELAPLEKDPKRKQELLERAAPSLERAVLLGAGPPWLALNSSDLLMKLGRTEQAIRHIESVLPVVSDSHTARMLAQRLSSLRAEQHIEAAEATAAEFDKVHRRTFPYLSEGLFLLLKEDTSAAGRSRAPQ